MGKKSGLTVNSFEKTGNHSWAFALRTSASAAVPVYIPSSLDGYWCIAITLMGSVLSWEMVIFLTARSKLMWVVTAVVVWLDIAMPPLVVCDRVIIFIVRRTACFLVVGGLVRPTVGVDVVSGAFGVCFDAMRAYVLCAGPAVPVLAGECVCVLLCWDCCIKAVNASNFALMEVDWFDSNKNGLGRVTRLVWLRFVRSTSLAIKVLMSATDSNDTEFMTSPPLGGIISVVSASACSLSTTSLMVGSWGWFWKRF